MDYRKYMNTPRDMIDDEMLLRLMKEYEPAAAVFGNNARRESRRRNNTETCGCRSGSIGDAPIRNRRSNRSDNCGGCETENRNCYKDRSVSDNCGCTNDNSYTEEQGNRISACDSCANDDRMKHFRLAMAYVPWQEWEMIYEDEVALTRGTLFEALDLPWYRSACDDGDRSCRKCGSR